MVNVHFRRVVPTSVYFRRVAPTRVYLRRLDEMGFVAEGDNNSTSAPEDPSSAQRQKHDHSTLNKEAFLDC